MNKIPAEPSQPQSSASMAVERLLGQMLPAMSDSFSDRQREALQAALAATWQKHPVDIRVSIPLLLRRYYVVVVAGSEKRSPERRRQDQGQRAVSMSGQIALAGAITTLGIGTLFLLMHFTRTQPNTTDRLPVSPAAIPFLTDRKTCEDSKRTWENGQCLDFEHDPTF